MFHNDCFFLQMDLVLEIDLEKGSRQNPGAFYSHHFPYLKIYDRTIIWIFNRNDR